MRRFSICALAAQRRMPQVEPPKYRQLVQRTWVVALPSLHAQPQIALVRTVRSGGLAVSGAPEQPIRLTKADAEKLKKELEEAGAKVELA